MKNAWALIFFFLSACFCSCNEQEHVQQPSEVLAEAPVAFFPVTDFIYGQINEIENLPITLLKVHSDGIKKDSAWLKKGEFATFALPFLRPEIDSSSMAAYFTGKSFLDQTINAFTFSYDAKVNLPDSINLAHWDVYIDPQKNRVQRVYMVKEDSIDRKPIIMQLTWKVGSWCSIRTITEGTTKQPVIKEEKVQWNFDEE